MIMEKKIICFLEKVKGERYFLVDNKTVTSAHKICLNLHIFLLPIINLFSNLLFLKRVTALCLNQLSNQRQV